MTLCEHAARFYSLLRANFLVARSCVSPQATNNCIESGPTWGWGWRQPRGRQRSGPRASPRSAPHVPRCMLESPITALGHQETYRGEVSIYLGTFPVFSSVPPYAPPPLDPHPHLPLFLSLWAFSGHLLFKFIFFFPCRWRFAIQMQ